MQAFARTMLLTTVIWGIMMFVLMRNQPPATTDTKPSQEILVEAKEHIKNKDYHVAEEQLAKVERNAKGSEIAAEAVYLRAQIDLELGNYRRAMETMQRMEREYGKSKFFQERGREQLTKATTAVDAENRTFTNYRILDSIVAFFGRTHMSYVLAIVVIALFVRLIQLPFANKQFGITKKMQQLAPKLNELKEKYQGQELMEKQMALYKRYKVNPFGGCLYMLVPFPFLIWVFNMINLYKPQFENGTFLWINPEIGKLAPGILAGNLAQFDVPLLILYALSMFITSRMSIMDPTQAQQQKMMSYMMTGMMVIGLWMWRSPAAFVLYWFLTNVLYTVHYKIAMAKPSPALVAVGEDPEEPAQGNGSAIMPKDFQRPKHKRKANRR